MRNVLILIFVLILLSSTSGMAAEAVKLKHFGSVYTDNAGGALTYPEGVACDRSFLIVADTANKRLVRFKLQGKSATPESPILLPEAAPGMIQMSAKGDLYVLDGKSRSVLKLDASGGTAEKLAIKGLPDANMAVLKSIKLDSKGHLYLLDIFTGRVIVASPEESFLRQIRLPEKAGFFSDLVVNDQGIIYLLDSVGAAVYQADAGSDNFTLISQGLKAYVNFPTHISVDRNGLLYIVDQNGSGLALIGRDGSFLGRRLASGWDEGMLQYPAQVCINDQAQLFVADRNNNRVQMFSILE